MCTLFHFGKKPFYRPPSLDKVIAEFCFGLLQLFAAMADIRETLKQLYSPRDLILEASADVKVMKVALGDTQQIACKQNYKSGSCSVCTD